VQNLMLYSCSATPISYKGNKFLHISLSFQDLTWDRHTTDVTTITKGSYTYSVRA